MKKILLFLFLSPFAFSALVPITSCAVGPNMYFKVTATGYSAYNSSLDDPNTVPPDNGLVNCTTFAPDWSQNMSEFEKTYFWNSTYKRWGNTSKTYTMTQNPFCNPDLNETLNTDDPHNPFCEVPPPPVIPCDDPNLIRDENGTCVCPGLGEEYNDQYGICLLDNPSCPIQLPPSCIHDITNNTYLRTFYDCIGKAASQTGDGPCTWPGEPDTDTDGIPDHLDNDIDGDGYSNDEEAARGSDPTDGSSTPAGLEGCNEDELGLNEKFAVDCVRECLDDYERDSFGVCQEKAFDVPSDCSTPSYYMGYPYQTITTSYTSCRILINSNGGKGAYLSLPSCDTGDMACFYNTGGSSSDNNSSMVPIDENSSNADILGQASLDKLSEIKDNLDVTNTSLSSINQAIDYQTDTLGSKLDSLKTVTSQSGDNINRSVNNLGSKLDGIQAAINNKPTGTDMTETNDLLSQINDKIGDREEGRAELDTEFAGGSSILNDALFSFAQNKDDIIAIATGAIPPSVTTGGSCSLSTAGTTFGAISFDFSFMSNLRPYFQFFLNLFLLYITIKFYVIIARDAVKLIGLI